MAFRANLSFEGKDFDVVQCNYSFHRDVDLKGRPSSNVYGGAIDLEVESTEDVTIFSQMVDQFKPNSGKITFNKGHEESKMKELSWENGYIIRFKEQLDVSGREPMTIRFSISAQKMSIDGVEIEQKWPK